MAKRKFTISVDESLMLELDRRVDRGLFESRSNAFELALGALVDGRLEGKVEHALKIYDVPTLELDGRVYAVVPKRDYVQLARDARDARKARKALSAEP
jgi:Arc/MetJ-type ribon-helix-helix transcriptional regulator